MSSLAEQTYSRPFPKPDRFWRLVTKTPTCWRWDGALNGYGYGVVSRYPNGVKRRYMAHRVAYELIVGPIPTGLTIDHLCRNKRCVNPAHLEPVTDRVNILRALVQNLHCPKGHRYTGKLDSRGDRVCVECIRIKNARYYAAERERLGRSGHNRAKTHCIRGHPLDGPDIYIDKRGRRQCRACERIRHRKNAA
jgi:hypothetical protein